MHVNDTYFIVAHFHYVMVGSVLFAFLGGLYHWWPKMFGRMSNELWGNVGAIAAVRRVQPDVLHPVRHGRQGNAAALRDVSGSSSRRYHVVSTIGAYVMAVGLFIRCVQPAAQPAAAAEGAGEPVGREHARVALPLAAAARQLPGRAGRRRPVRHEELDLGRADAAVGARRGTSPHRRRHGTDEASSLRA